eukprot:gb/GFBE01026818.1/.p1 GENE.gb/GFBE01026818.1/~~gb/GFBE01026818.1/.p1  ORF type:complete len:696 (+),score=279.25 gb/GFBE01026818.1/:1-2088(+)
MKTFCKCLLALLVAVDAVSPMEKVMTMLADLKEKVINDGKAEDVTFDKYEKFYVKTKRNLGYEIQDGEKTVEELQANIDKASSEAEVSATRVQTLQNSIAKTDADLQAALEIRQKEKAEHETAKTELQDAGDMLGKAIKTLSDKLAGSSLLQQQVDDKEGGLLKALSAVVDAASFPNAEKESLLALVEGETIQAPEVAAYSSKSGNIISTLEDMKQKAKDDLTALMTQETAAQHSFAMLQQSLKQQIDADQKELDQVKASKSEAEEEKASATGNLDVTAKDLANDKVSLEKLESSWSQAQIDYQTSKSSRAEELEALDKATEVLKEKTGNAEAGVYKPAALFQVRAHNQVRSSITTPNDLHSFEVVQIVRNLAKKSKSTGLESLAANIESLVQTNQATDATGDVFAKVKELIDNMIVSRQKEAAAESTKKAYCDEEQTKTKGKVEDLSGKKEALSAKVDKKESAATTMKTEAATLQKELTDLASMQAEMDQARGEESASYKTQKADLEAGLEGVRSALSVLRDYYQGGAALIQTEQPTFGHSQDTGASTGIVGMLEVIESDFARNLAEAETTEATKAEDYEKMTEQNKLTKVQKEADQKYKEKTSAALFQAVQELSSDSESAQEELDAVLKYQESLAQQCLDGSMSYEERVAKREEEINGLKEALVALGGTDLSPVLLQGSSKALRGASASRHLQ